MTRPDISRLIAETEALQARLNATSDRYWQTQSAIREAEQAAALRERERIDALKEAENYRDHPKRAAGLIDRYLNGDQERRNIIRAAVANLMPYRDVELGIHQSHPNYAHLPEDGRLVTLGAFLGIMSNDNLQPDLVFHPELLRQNIYRYRHFAGPADLHQWQQALPTIRRHLDPDLEWLVRQVDSVHIELTCRLPLPEVFTFDPSELRHDHFSLGWSLADASPFHVPFDDILHMLIAGATGSGKSTAMHGMIAAALYSRARFEDIYLYDGKAGEEFSRYDGLDGVTILRRREDLYQAGSDLVALMERRHADNAANRRRRYVGGITWLVIDECQSVFDHKPDKADKERHAQFLVHIADLARRARSSNIRLLFTTQKPTADAIPTEILANLSTRLAFRLGLAVTQHGMFPGVEGLPNLTTLKKFQGVYVGEASPQPVLIQVGIPDDDLDGAALIAAGQAARLAPPVEITPAAQLIAVLPPEPSVPLSDGCTDLDPPADDVETRHDEPREPVGMARGLSASNRSVR